MRKLLAATALVAVFAVGPAFAQSVPTDATPDRGTKGADSVTPGAVGPGSENNATVSPTFANDTHALTATRRYSRVIRCQQRDGWDDGFARSNATGKLFGTISAVKGWKNGPPQIPA